MLQLEDAAIWRAVIDSLELGIHVVDRNLCTSYWSRAAEKITGYAGAEVLGRQCCKQQCIHGTPGSTQQPCACPLRATMEDGETRHSHIYLRHKLGHAVPVRARTAVLRGGKGEIAGAVESFVEMQAEAGESYDGMAALQGIPEQAGIPRSREYVASWLERSVQAIDRDHQPFGVLQIQVDQLPRLRVTHGREATEALMRVIAQSLICSLHSSDVFGRWSDSGFLVIARDANSLALELDADLLRTLAKSVEFRWWGDRIPITVSVGGTMARPGDSLQLILPRLAEALGRGMAIGGDRVVVVEREDAGRELGLCTQ